MSSAVRDEMGIAKAFMDLYARMAADPVKLAGLSMNLWLDHMRLWQSSWMKLMGLESGPVAQPEKSDGRFKDEDWSKSFMFDLNEGVAEAIKAGDVQFAVDQQQYEQGYLPIVMLQLYAKNLNTLIAGDMLLSTISTNVSVWSIDPEGDPLRLFLDSIARYRDLPKDVLVLPSHGKPFRGAHDRVAQLEKHHQDRLGELLESLKKPQSAADLLSVLFRRPLDAHQTFFAMGEAIAHLHYLYYAGRAKRAQGEDGIMRYATS